MRLLQFVIKASSHGLHWHCRFSERWSRQHFDYDILRNVASCTDTKCAFALQVIRKCTSGFSPAVLHAILKSVIFIGDFDSALVKSVEGELVAKIMSRYEAELCDKASRTPIEGAHSTTTPRSADDITRDFVVHLIDDVSSGVDLAKSTEKILGVFKVSSVAPSFSNELSGSLLTKVVVFHRVTCPFTHRHFVPILRRR